MEDRPKDLMTRAGLNLIAQALSIYDDDLRLAVSNAPFQSMFDLPDDLVTPGATFEDTIRHLATRGEYGPIENLSEFIAERVAQARAFAPHYMERTRSNGRTISVEGSPLPEGGWVTVYTDITTTKAQEALLRDRSDELSEALLAQNEELAATNRKLAATITALEETKRQLTATEARTRLTTEMMPAHIAHVDETARYTFSNRRLSAILPDRPSDIVGLPMADALGTSAYSRIEPFMRRALSGEASVSEFTDVASARRIRVAFTPDGHGGAYILSTDITEETQTRVALQQTRRRTLAAQMTSGLAHDFSNLLTIIMGLQGQLERMEHLPEGAAKLIDGTLAATRRGGALLDRIGDMSSSRPYRAQATNLHEILPDLETMARASLPDGISLSMRNDVPAVPLLLDAAMLQDALLNLVLNARDACETSGTIDLSAATVADTWIELAVSDTGPGFDDDVLERAFEPFFTTKGKDGSGLGLPMVYDMAKLAGGDLWIKNTETGACVTLRLPLRKAPTLSKRMVLLVEDEPDIRTDIRNMLTEMGHTVIEAASVSEAIALTKDIADIGMILSDINLTGEQTGVDLAKRFDGSHHPTILMTSLPHSDPLHREAASLGPVLQKPFTQSDLMALLAPKVHA